MNSRNLILAILVFGGAIIGWRMILGTPKVLVHDGKPLAEVVVPKLDEMAQAGEAAFNANCAICHGKNAAGKDGVAPPLVHKIYETSHHGDASFVLAAQRGVRAHHWPFGDMPPMPNVSETEISSVIAYVRTLQRANGIN